MSEKVVLTFVPKGGQNNFDMTSLEQRQQIRDLVQQGLKAPGIAAQLDVSVHTVRKWQQRLKKGARCIRLWAVQHGVR